MGYYVRLLKCKKTAPNWKVQFISCKRSDQRSTNPGTEKRAWDISKDRWRVLGFNPSMLASEAKSRARQLNTQIHAKRQEEYLKQANEKKSAFLLRHESVLPEEFVAEFEERFVRASGPLTDIQKQRRNKQRYTTWRAAQKMIVAVGIEPANWFYHNDYFYDFIFQKQLSINYARTILNMANTWGHYICRKLGQPFHPVKSPGGYERQRILEAFYKKETHQRRPSKSTVPGHLEKVRQVMNRQNFNWLYLSVWFGLRPQEIDQLHDKNLWRIEELPSGRKVLWVFQTKIIALPEEDRWKPIPIIYDEQKFALKIVLDKNFKRPLVKTVRKFIGDGHDLYGGRKGFVDLMMSKGQSLQSISIWMGHSTLSRTWRSYKNKRIYHD